MKREYFFNQEEDKIKIYGITYGVLFNDVRKEKLIGTLFYDKQSKEITFNPNPFTITYCEAFIDYLHNLIKTHGDELRKW